MRLTEFPYLPCTFGHMDVTSVMDPTDTQFARGPDEKAGRRYTRCRIVIGQWRCSCCDVVGAATVPLKVDCCVNFIGTKKNPMEKTIIRTNKVMYYVSWFVPMLAHEIIQVRSVDDHTSVASALTVRGAFMFKLRWPSIVMCMGRPKTEQSTMDFPPHHNQKKKEETRTRIQWHKNYKRLSVYLFVCALVPRIAIPDDNR